MALRPVSRSRAAPASVHMTAISATVTVDLKALEKFEHLFVGDLKHAGAGPLRKAMKKWAFRYRSFLSERYDAFSKGGGDWPPIKRPHKRGGTTILRDTGTMFAALAPSVIAKPGSITEDIPFGIRVGYGGPMKHPSGSATIADIASFHQVGAGNLPVRKTIVPPDDKTLKAMSGDMDVAIAELKRASGSD